MRTEGLKGALLSTLVIASLLAPMLVLTSTAEAQVPSIVVMKGKDTAYTINQTGDPPWYEYEVGDRPVVMVAKRVGSGGVVAAGIVPTVRSSPTPGWTHPANPLQHLDILFDDAFRWMVPGAVNVLWYQGYNVYNTIDLCYELVEALENKGYTVTPDATQPITSGLLSGYDILVLPQLQLGDAGTGGNPDFLPDADVQAIVDFVNGGGGLFIMDGSDFGGHHFSKVMNKVLEGLGFDYFFQDDQVSDLTNNWDASDYRPIVEVDTTTDIGSAYQAAAGTAEIGLYSICSLARGGPGVSLYVLPDYQVGMPGATLEYTITVTNPENPLAENLTYDIIVGETADWSPQVENASLFVPVGEKMTTTLTITVPPDTSLSMEDEIIVFVVAVGYPEVISSFTCIAHAGKRIEPFDDVYVSDQDNDANYSGENSLRVGRYYEYWQWAYLKFDLSEIPSDANITEARLYLYAYYKYVGGFDVLCYGVEDDNWTESTITWNTKPTLGSTLDTKFVNDASYDSPKSYSWDVTSSVVNEFAGDNRASFCLRPPDDVSESTSRAFWSKERYENRVRPFLRVSYTTEVIPATININSNILNLKSRGRWITCFIELPEGYSVEDIDVSTIRLLVDNDNVAAEPRQTGISGKKLMVKFSRSAVQAIIGMGEVELAVTGLVDDMLFEGNDTIRVIKPGKVDLEARFLEIPLEWAMSPPDNRIILEREFLDLPYQWSIAPS